jgi:hypothetical protein
MQLNYRMEQVILNVAHTYPVRCLACICAHIETLRYPYEMNLLNLQGYL